MSPADSDSPGPAMAPAAPPAPAADDSDPPGLRVLVVEDNLINQKLVAHLLTNMGCRVDVASNGLQCLVTLQHQPYDLVFMDIQMPEMDGLTTTRHIRAGDAGELNRRTFIVALTADGLLGDQRKFLDAGMDHHLSKPFMRPELAAILERVRGAATTRQPPPTAP